MKNLFVGIDISKEKLNLCYRKGLRAVLEEEVANDVKSHQVCAEYTGRYIYPLTVACQEMDVFLWLDDRANARRSAGLRRDLRIS